MTSMNFYRPLFELNDISKFVTFKYHLLQTEDYEKYLHRLEKLRLFYLTKNYGKGMSIVREVDRETLETKSWSYNNIEFHLPTYPRFGFFNIVPEEFDYHCYTNFGWKGKMRLDNLFINKGRREFIPKFNVFYKNQIYDLYDYV